MGFLDKVKEKSVEAAEKGRGLAKVQQLKLELKRLDSALEEAYAAFGRKAHSLHQAGTLQGDGLDAEAQNVHEAQAARDAKEAEIAAVGDET